ncbi:MAG: hypothetical protein ACYTKD_03555 [Planctomycetota bacterium]
MNLPRAIPAIAAMVLGLAPRSGAAEFFVAPDGNNENPGTLAEPLATPAPVMGRLAPGDVVSFRGGRYDHTRAFAARNLRGREGRPIVFRAYPGERPLFDGTVRLRGTWRRHADVIYKVRVDRPMWQLFVGRRVMSEARWPTMLYHDGYCEGTVWDREGRYAQAAVPGSSPTKTVDIGLPGRRLVDVEGSFEGGLLVANNASWHTNAMKITAHSPGADHIEHAETGGADRGRVAGHLKKAEAGHAKAVRRSKKSGKTPGPLGLWYYFVTDSLACLDDPQEWCFEGGGDAGGGTVYFCPPDRADPTGTDVRGKVVSYAVVVRDCEHVVLDGLGFFACTFAVVGSSRCEVRNSDLAFPSTVMSELGKSRACPTIISTDSRAVRALQGANDPLGRDGAGPPVWEAKAPPAASAIESPGGNVLYNCAFLGGTQGPGLEVAGPAARVENCRFENLDWYLAATPGFGLTMSSPGGALRRNTIRTSGCSEGVKIGAPQTIELNHISDCGHLQNDGGQFQTSPGGQQGVIYRHNWSHDSNKYAIRFDGDVTKGMKPGVDPDTIAKGGKYGNIVANVAWNTNRTIYVKGNYHRVVGNTSFNHWMADIVVRGFKDKTGWENSRTITLNNCTTYLSASRSEMVPKAHPVPGTVSHNRSGRNIRGFLRDPDNLDFRPKTGSAVVDAARGLRDVDFRMPGAKTPTQDIGQLLLFPKVGRVRDIGAYEFGATYYWIPGRKLPRASTPVPPDGAGAVKADADLMWLEGLGARAHRVFFGSDERAVAGARKGSPEFMVELPATTNIFTPRERPAEGVTYFWRVDVVREGGAVINGEVWRFSRDGEPHVRRRWPPRGGGGGEAGLED